MELILLDTNFVSVLFDPRRPNFDAVHARAETFAQNDLVYLSAIVLAELRYGMEAAQRVGQDISHIRQTLAQAANYPLAEVGRHTAEAYGDVKARLAEHYLDLSRRTPRWLENWQDRASGQMLQVDENDLWIVAQAVERDYLLVTSDQRLADRFVPVIAELRLSVV
ncbi:PIN domain-containing protein [Agrobacterium leguminum]|uniref:PIN domain-containing protein n=1 Tax=Agrobacterium leguminum TaxID=2792015 RepID=UPI0030D4AACE